MIFRKRGSLRQSIEQKDSGQTVWVTGMFFLLVLCILLYAQFQIMSWHATSLMLEDALAASDLASELIDIREYGKTHKVLIADPEKAYDIYCSAVRENLQLDSQWFCDNKDLIGGRVEIADFIMYNVEKQNVTASRIGRGGYVTESWSGTVGEEYAPNGVGVDHTGIYSEIMFPVQGFLGITVQAHKGKLSDIVSETEITERGEEDEIR